MLFNWLLLGSVFLLTATTIIHQLNVRALNKEIRELKQNVDHLYTRN